MEFARDSSSRRARRDAVLVPAYGRTGEDDASDLDEAEVGSAADMDDDDVRCGDMGYYVMVVSCGDMNIVYIGTVLRERGRNEQVNGF